MHLVKGILKKSIFFIFHVNFCAFWLIKNQKKYKKSIGTIQTNNFAAELFFRKPFKPLKIDIKNSLNLHFLRFWPLLVQNGHFLKILNLYARIEKPILIFLKKILETKLLIYNVFFRFLSIFLEKKHFGDVFTYHLELWYRE